MMLICYLQEALEKLMDEVKSGKNLQDNPSMLNYN